MVRIKKRYIIPILVLLLGCLLYTIFHALVHIDEPEVGSTPRYSVERQQCSKFHYEMGSSWLNKNSHGLWELYVEGDAYDRGLKIGALSQELMEYQEGAFISAISDMVPADKSIDLIKYLIAWQNRHLPDYIPDEYQLEMLGVSKYLSDRYDFVADKFQRKMYYHAAHDIGHTVQNMGLVGCSAFSAWGNKTMDGSLLIGRNFDFFVGEDFAKHKVILFVNPNIGIPFMSYTWPGMIGVVSGMNQAGLSISINAGPPALPQPSKMPVSILARKILQYASTIDEAIAIANKEEVFISEIFLIGSGKENMSIILEKSPNSTSIVASENTATVNYQIATNHFQSDHMQDQENNLSFMDESSTVFRNKKLNQLLSDTFQIDEVRAVEYLRDWTDLNGDPLGIGNEMGINQMIAHHSIVFKPQQKEVWVSTGNSPMDAFISYNLDSVFQHRLSPIYDLKNANIIEEDKWMRDGGLEAYTTFKSLQIILEDFPDDFSKGEEIIHEMIRLNPDLYATYNLAGKFLAKHNRCEEAIKMWELALTKDIAWLSEREEIVSNKLKCLN